MGTPVKSHIIFQAYGSEDILHECLFALLSLSRVLAPEERASVQICIYTDRPSFFQRYSDCPLNIVYRLLEEPQVRLWRGTIDFVHRVKIEVLRDYSASHSGAFLYLDTDVVFTESPLPILEDIGKGAFYMHIMEGVLKESAHPLLRKAASFLATRKIRVQGKDVIIPPKAAMWNAGVLGFDSQSAHLLEEVLAFTDTVYPLFRKG